MTGYTKLFGSILGSTIWRESLPTKVIWVTMRAMVDRDGIVEASVVGLAHFAGAKIEGVGTALRLLLSPDPHSRSSQRADLLLAANGKKRLTFEQLCNKTDRVPKLGCMTTVHRFTDLRSRSIPNFESCTTQVQPVETSLLTG